MLLSLIIASLAGAFASKQLCVPRADFLDDYSTLLSPPYKQIFQGEPIYKGHFGRVYPCTVNSYESVAKLVSIKKSSHYMTVKNEQKMAQLLENTKGIIVPYACVINENQTVSLFMLRKGPSLAALREDFKKLSFHRQLAIFIRIGELFIYLRKESIIHNDFKPGNIVAQDRNFSDVFIIDFGGACLHGETCRGGTHSYSPPEKLRKNHHVTGEYSIDLWSYLVSVISLHTGARGKQIEDIFKKTPECWKNMTIECYNFLMLSFKASLKNAPAWFSETILGAMRYTPEKRPHIEDFVAQLRAQGRAPAA